MTGTTTMAGWVPERQRYSIRTAAKTLKAVITIEDYLRAHDVEPKRNRARCIVHDGDNPQSFSIEPEKQLWHCFACGQGGDLIDLCELVERHADAWTAVVSLSVRFGVELPERPPRWFENQERKARIRDAAEEVRANVLKRRLFRLLILPTIDASCPDADEHEAELERAWAEWSSKAWLWRGIARRAES